MLWRQHSAVAAMYAALSQAGRAFDLRHLAVAAEHRRMGNDPVARSAGPSSLGIQRPASNFFLYVREVGNRVILEQAPQCKSLLLYF